jgi:hypothetical protein
MRRCIPAKRGLMAKCQSCKNKYDIAQLALNAEREGKRNLYCPHCYKRVGQLQ